MTTQTEALKLALEALKKSDGFLYNWHENYADDEADAYAAARQLNEQAIIAAEKALAQPEQEPVATFDEVWDSIEWDKWRMEPIRELCRMIISKTTPPQRKPLTDEQRKSITAMWSRGHRNYTVGDIIDAVEEAHGINKE